MAKTPGTADLKGLVGTTARAKPMPSAFVLNDDGAAQSSASGGR